MTLCEAAMSNTHITIIALKDENSFVNSVVSGPPDARGP